MAPLRHILLTVAATAVAWTAGWGQTGDGGVWDIPRTGGESITEPSPEATAMRRYQDYPVSYATGTADISIPLLELPGGATSVQLGLSYHTGGIRKTDISTGVGLGWTLTGLGSVSRQINGFPDEWRGNGPGVTHDVREDPHDFDYLLSIIEARTDAEYDIYSYNFPGYSGRFLIKGDQIVQLPQTDLWITRVPDTYNPAATDAFVFRTPEGYSYRFDVKETIDFDYFPAPLPEPYYPQSYTAVSTWQLSRITSPFGIDEITIDYKPMSQWVRENGKRMNGDSMSYGPDATTNSYQAAITRSEESPEGVNRTTFRNQRLPLKITSRSGSVEFSIGHNLVQQGYAPRDYISAIDLKDRANNIIRKVEFDNTGKYSDDRQRLDAVKIYSGATLTDSYSFTYYDTTPTLGCDIFGYANGRSTGYLYNILNGLYTISPERTTDTYYLTCNSLESITDISGAITKLTYEPSKVNIAGSEGYSVFNGETVIGLRLRSILTADGTVPDDDNRRKRIRNFSYESPMCNVALHMLSYGDFISQSGVESKVIVPDASHDTYSMGISYTGSAKCKGYPAESAVIYYGKVTEEISGTDIGHPVKTTYEYDLTNVSHLLIDSAKDFDPDDGYWMETKRVTSNYGKFLGGFCNSVIVDYERKLLTYYPTRWCIEENIGAQPLLNVRTEYEWIGGAYRERKIERSYYSRTGQNRMINGVFCESAVFKYRDYTGTHLNVTSIRDLNYFTTTVACSRSVLDSVVTTTCYPDVAGSPSRTVRNRYFNESKDIYSAPGFYFNSWLLPTGKTFYPLGSSTSCGDESVTATTLTSEYATEINMQEAAMMGVRRLPWAERWVVRTSAGSDSLFRHYQYSFRTVGGKRFMRPDAVTVEVNRSASHSDPTLDTYNPDTISVQRYSDYDARGRIREMTDAAGRSIKAAWDTCYDYLTSLSLPDVGQTTTYTYRPLVGCTSITSPSGRKRQFGYVAGRLASERNTAGQTVATYSYRLFGDGSDSADPANRFTATLHDDSGEASQTVDYDGFGLPVRTVADVAGGGQTSTAVEYDALDRPVRQYLPVPCSGGVAQDPKTYYGDNYPYRSTTYRPLRTDAPLSVIAEGALMQSHPATVEYLCNTTSGDASLRCRRYSLGSSATSETVTLSGNYPAGALDVTRSTDPDGHRVLTFTDWRGFKILERRIVDAAKSEFADTYWLYDPMGRVRVIIQPEGSGLMTATGSSWTNSSTPLKQYAFISRYDRRGNCIYSLTPGGGPVRMAYDPLNRLALRQTATMAERGEAEFMLYDPVGRPAVTGIMRGSFPDDKAPSTAVTFTASETGIGNSGYKLSDTDTATLLSDVTLTAVTYYDTYACRSFAGFSGISASFTGDASLANGLPTATCTAVYAHDPANDYKVSSYLYILMGYDREGRVTQQVETTALAGSKLITNTTYTRQGRPSMTDIALHTTDSIYNVQLLPDYDATGSLIHESSIVNSERLYTVKPLSAISGNQAVVTYSYDALGRLSKKQLNSGQSIDYAYNLRGQLTGLTHPAFAQTLYYETGTSPCYNGNISSIKFKPDGVSGVTRVYTYDPLNRLTACTSTDGYNTSYRYNLNSSPLTIKRYGMISDKTVGLVDDLQLTYGGNRVLAVSDAADRVVLESSLDFDAGNDDALYGYDADGRMISDTGRGITSISYAPNDRPVYTKMEDATFDYLYSADGRKLKSKAATGFRKLKGLEPFADELADAPDGKGDLIIDPVIPVVPSIGQPTEERYHIGPFELTKSYKDKMVGAIMRPGLARVNMSWGYVDSNGNNCEYVTDYQGNIRAVMKGNQVIQQTDYYPYGLPMATSTGAAVNRYKYSGKEFDTRGGLNSYDFHARRYAPALPLFDCLDPKAIYTPWHSTYLYCAGNPINMTDKSGMREWPVDNPYKGVHPINSDDFGVKSSDRGHPHGGVDINIGSSDFDLGAPVYATHDGIVVRVVDLNKPSTSDTNGGGSRIKIQSEDGAVSTFYMHLNTVEENIVEGAKVTENQVIGTVGGSGKGELSHYSPHLHYEINLLGNPISPSNSKTELKDPQSYIGLKNIDLPEATVTFQPRIELAAPVLTKPDLTIPPRKPEFELNVLQSTK